MNRVSLAAIGLVLVATVHVRASIISVPIFNPATSHWYALVSSGASGDWANAEAEAVDSGGHLVTINDAAEEAWLRANFSTTTRYWIGYNDRAVEGTFVWTSGETPGYTNWDAGEPNNSMPPPIGEDETVLNWVATGEWNDWSHLRPDYTHIDGIGEFMRRPIPEPMSLAVWAILCTCAASGWRGRRRRS